VQGRNSKVVDAAARSNAILSSLFPSNVRNRLFAEMDEEGGAGTVGAPRAKHSFDTNNDSADQETAPVTDTETEQLGYAGKPIADLFPETTVSCLAGVYSFICYLNVWFTYTLFFFTFLLRSCFLIFQGLLVRCRWSFLLSF
jgi:hypothetical protein